MKKLANREFQNRHFGLPRRGYTPSMCILQDINDSALPHTKSAGHGQNWENEKISHYQIEFFSTAFKKSADCSKLGTA